jgi:hypothetical protein
MDEEMKKLGYNIRFIRILTDEKKKFFIDNDEIIDNIKERIKEEFSTDVLDDNKILKLIEMSIDPIIDNGFAQVVNKIIKSEIRNHKISKILEESIVYSFKEFIKL